MLAQARVVMTLLFGLWVWLDPAQPARAGSGVAPLLAAYTLVALALLWIARRSWWFEHRLAGAAFLIDTLVFGAGLYATEAVTLDLFSVFITFFAFLILSAATRWSRKTTVAIAVGLVLCFLLAGLLLFERGLDLDWPRFLRRLAYLALLATLLVWFGPSRSVAAVARFPADSPAAERDPLRGTLDYAMCAYGASDGVLAWLDEGELQPRIVGATIPAAPPAIRDQDQTPFLFDRARRRRLTLDAGNRLLAGHGPASERTDAACISEGLAIPLRCRAGRGLLLLAGIPGLCRDDLLTACALATEIGRAIDDELTRALEREVAMSRLRSELAADLHDSVAQTLAGVQFRLEALKHQVATGQATAEDVADIGHGIAAEQRHVRTMIDRLRLGTIAPGQRDLRQDLLAITGLLATQWQVEIELDASAEPVPAAPATIYQAQQVVREAVANAMRHGHATRIEIGLAATRDGGFTLEVQDNGSGCPEPESTRPRSISERVATIGGTMTFRSVPGKTCVRISAPGAGR